MNWWEWLVIVAAIAGIAYLIWRFRFRKDVDDYEGEVFENYKATTPKGARVYSPNGIDQAKLEAIDAGLDRAFSVAETVENYHGFNRHDAYKIWLFPRSGPCEQPGIIERRGATAWDQHPEYDKDPREGHTAICFTGKMRRTGNVGTGSPGMVVVDELSVLEETIYNEAEHNILVEVDPERHMNTSGVHAHPLFNTARSLVERPFSCGTTKADDQPQTKDPVIIQ